MSNEFLVKTAENLKMPSSKLFGETAKTFTKLFARFCLLFVCLSKCVERREQNNLTENWSTERKRARLITAGDCCLRKWESVKAQQRERKQLSMRAKAI